MPNVRIRLKDSAPANVRFHLGSSSYSRSFSKEDSPNVWVVTQEEFDKVLKPSGYFEIVTGEPLPQIKVSYGGPAKPVETKASGKAVHFDVGRIK